MLSIASLVLLAHLVVLDPPDSPLSVSTPLLLFNPVLAIVILGAGYAWGMLLERGMKRWLPQREPTIDFVSDRQKVSVPVGSILYIESRDTEVYVHLADGTAYRNKTPISRWESILERMIAEGEKLGLSRDFITTVFNAIHDESVRVQKL